MAVEDNAILSYVMRDIEINRDTLALDVIDRVGPGGNFYR
jgi:trimethylamine:corrinoid methyltransferase-like protein